jgi:hypothetical protein
MSELSDESRALIESEGPLDEATPAEIEAMHLRVVALLAGAPAPAPSPSPDPTPLLGKAAAATSLKVVGSAIAAAVGSSALLFALSQPASEPSTAPSAPPPVMAAPQPPVAAPALTPSADIALEPAPAVSAAPVAAPLPRANKSAAPAPSAAPSSASEEALLVATAEAQLRSGHAAAALALYEQHLREYPKGALRHESQSGRIVALCGVGRGAEARAEIERFAARHPSSPSLLRMQRACGSEP